MKADLVKSVVEYIEEQTSSHKNLFFDMGTWHSEVTPDNKAGQPESSECGTYMCFAGWAAKYAGLPVKGEDEWGNEVTVDGEDIVEWVANYFEMEYEDADAICLATGVKSDIGKLKERIDGVLVENIFGTWKEIE